MGVKGPKGRNEINKNLLRIKKLYFLKVFQKFRKIVTNE